MRASRRAARPPVRFVFFDAGGTLLAPRPAVGVVYARAARPFGLRAGAAEIESAFRAAWRARCAGARAGRLAACRGPAQERRFWRGVVGDVLRRVGFRGDEEGCFEACFAAFSAARAWRVYRDVRPAIAELAGRGLELGVLSNWDGRLPELLRALGLARHFRAVVVSAGAGLEKPDPRFFRLACERVGQAPGRVMHVGDSRRLDFEAARRAGCAALLLDRRNAERGPGVIRSLRAVSSRLPVPSP